MISTLNVNTIADKNAGPQKSTSNYGKNKNNKKVNGKCIVKQNEHLKVEFEDEKNDSNVTRNSDSCIGQLQIQKQVKEEGDYETQHTKEFKNVKLEKRSSTINQVKRKKSRVHTVQAESKSDQRKSIRELKKVQSFHKKKELDKHSTGSKSYTFCGKTEKSTSLFPNFNILGLFGKMKVIPVPLSGNKVFLKEKPELQQKLQEALLQAAKQKKLSSKSNRKVRFSISKNDLRCIKGIEQNSKHQSLHKIKDFDKGKILEIVQKYSRIDEIRSETESDDQLTRRKKQRANGVKTSKLMESHKIHTKKTGSKHRNLDINCQSIKDVLSQKGLKSSRNLLNELEKAQIAPVNNHLSKKNVNESLVTYFVKICSNQMGSTGDFEGKKDARKTDIFPILRNKSTEVSQEMDKMQKISAEKKVHKNQSHNSLSSSKKVGQIKKKKNHTKLNENRTMISKGHAKCAENGATLERDSKKSKSSSDKSVSRVRTVSFNNKPQTIIYNVDDCPIRKRKCIKHSPESSSIQDNTDIEGTERDISPSESLISLKEVLKLQADSGSSVNYCMSQSGINIASVMFFYPENPPPLLLPCKLNCNSDSMVIPSSSSLEAETVSNWENSDGIISSFSSSSQSVDTSKSKNLTLLKTLSCPSLFLTLGSGTNDFFTTLNNYNIEKTSWLNSSNSKQINCFQYITWVKPDVNYLLLVEVPCLSNHFVFKVLTPGGRVNQNVDLTQFLYKDIVSSYTLSSVSQENLLVNYTTQVSTTSFDNSEKRKHYLKIINHYFHNGDLSRSLSADDIQSLCQNNGCEIKKDTDAGYMKKRKNSDFFHILSDLCLLYKKAVNPVNYVNYEMLENEMDVLHSKLKEDWTVIPRKLRPTKSEVGPRVSSTDSSTVAEWSYSPSSYSSLKLELISQDNCDISSYYKELLSNIINCEKRPIIESVTTGKSAAGNGTQDIQTTPQTDKSCPQLSILESELTKIQKDNNSKVGNHIEKYNNSKFNNLERRNECTKTSVKNPLLSVSTNELETPEAELMANKLSNLLHKLEGKLNAGTEVEDLMACISSLNLPLPMGNGGNDLSCLLQDRSSLKEFLCKEPGLHENESCQTDQADRKGRYFSEEKHLKLVVEEAAVSEVKRGEGCGFSPNCRSQRKSSASSSKTTSCYFSSEEFILKNNNSVPVTKKKRKRMKKNIPVKRYTLETSVSEESDLLLQSKLQELKETKRRRKLSTARTVLTCDASNESKNNMSVLTSLKSEGFELDESNKPVSRALSIITEDVCGGNRRKQKQKKMFKGLFKKQIVDQVNTLEELKYGIKEKRVHSPPIGCKKGHHKQICAIS